MCVRACCVRIHVFWLCGCICILVVCTHVRAHTRRGKVECRSCFLPVLHSHRACILIFITVHLHNCVSSVSGDGDGECILISSANTHRDLFLSSVTGFPTNCPTSSAVIPGALIAHRFQSPLCYLCPGRKRPRVEAPAAALSCGSTALGFCLLLSCQSSYRNVVSWAATLLSNVNAIGQWEKKIRGRKWRHRLCYYVNPIPFRNQGKICFFEVGRSRGSRCAGIEGITTA